MGSMSISISTFTINCSPEHTGRRFAVANDKGRRTSCTHGEHANITANVAPNLVLPLWQNLQCVQVPSLENIKLLVPGISVLLILLCVP